MTRGKITFASISEVFCPSQERREGRESQSAVAGASARDCTQCCARKQVRSEPRYSLYVTLKDLPVVTYVFQLGTHFLKTPESPKVVTTAGRGTCPQDKPQLAREQFEFEP